MWKYVAVGLAWLVGTASLGVSTTVTLIIPKWSAVRDRGPRLARWLLCWHIGLGGSTLFPRQELENSQDSYEFNYEREDCKLIRPHTRAMYPLSGQVETKATALVALLVVDLLFFEYGGNTNRNIDGTCTIDLCVM